MKCFLFKNSCNFLKSLFAKNVDMFSQSNPEFLEGTWIGFIALVLDVLGTDVVVKTGILCLSSSASTSIGLDLIGLMESSWK